MERIPHTTDKMDLTVFRDRTICWRLVAGSFCWKIGPGDLGSGIWDLAGGLILVVVIGPSYLSSL